MLLSYISNPLISFWVVAIVGIVCAIRSQSWKWPLVIAVLLIFGNLIYEYGLDFMNVRDPVDAWLGVGGATLGWLFSVAVRRWGLR